MKKNVLILGIAIAFPMALMAQAPRGGGPGHLPGPPPGPGHDGGGPGGEVHDDPHRNPMFHALLRAIDADGDGLISMGEMNHAADALLALDKNSDGKLSHEELCPPHHGPNDGHQPPPPRGPKPDPDKKDPDAAAAPAATNAPAAADAPATTDAPSTGNPPPPPPAPPEDEQRSALVDAIDTNHDGKLDAAEIDAARANLKKLDMNHDGKLTPNEYGRPHHKSS